MKVNKKALIFDMDGVIVDTEPHNMQQVYAYVRSLRPEVPVGEMYQIVGRTSKDVWTRIAGIIGRGMNWEETRRDYEENWKPWHPYPVNYREIFRKESLTILRWAKEQGMLTAVASATAYDKVKAILTEVGVLPYLDLIISGESVKRSKPDPEIYVKAAECLGVLPQECIAIEDSTVGITAARCAGVTVVALKDDRFGFDQSLADGKIAELREFLDWYSQS
ncbi:MAG: HAD family phosphatase [Lachnospiraceae bacterium]|nr:HAD family phosphatase [Lachnospiraceae bacterium]